MRSAESQARRHQRITSRDRSRRSRATVRNETLEPRRLFAAVHWDGGGDGSNWADPNNWNTNQVPGPADDVTINRPGTLFLTIHGGTVAQVRSLDCHEFLDVGLNATLSVATPSHIRPGVRVWGTIAGAGDLTAGFFGMYHNSAMTSGGRAIVNDGGLFLVNGDVTVSRTVLSGGEGSWLAGDIKLNGGAIYNSGTWRCGAANDPRDLVIRGTGANDGFNNTGTFYVDNGSVTALAGPAAAPFYNFGTVHVSGGNLAALGGGQNAGAIVIDQPARTFTVAGSQLFVVTSSVSGAGRFQLASPGTMEFRGTVNVGTLASSAASAGFSQGTVAANRLEVTGGGQTWFGPAVSFHSGLISGGRVNVNSDATFTSSLTWSGGLIGGPGRFVIPAGSLLSMVGTAGRGLNGRLDVNGQATWSEGLTELAGTLTNNGVFRIEPASAAALTMRDISLGSTSRFVNNGTLLKRNGAAATMNVNLTQNGGINVEQGELKLASVGSHTTGATNRAGIGATLALGNTHTFASNGSFNSFQGKLRIDGGDSAYGGSLVGAENLTLAGGTFTLGGAPARTIDFTGGTGVINGNGTINGGSMSAGEWRGSGNVTIASHFAWMGGTIGGTGTLTTAAPDSALEVSGTAVHRAARPFVLRGYTNWLGGDIDVTESGSIRNEGNFGAMNETGTVRLFRSGGGAPFVNNGTFAKFFGGAARVESTFNNAGLVTIPGGAIALEQGGIHGGDFNVAQNATLELGGGHNLNAGSAVTGSGLFRLSGAIVNVADSQTYDGEIFVTPSSALTLRGDRTQVRELTVSGVASMAPGGSRLLSVRSLDVKPDAMLDIADNTVIVDYSGPSPIDAIRTALRSGYANGLWNGTGIRSSAMQAGMAIGYAESADLFTSFPATFAGEPIDATAVVMRKALRGDANLDGRVNLADFNRLAGAFGSASGTWSRGDCNYDGNVNLIDFNALASNFGRDLVA